MPSKRPAVPLAGLVGGGTIFLNGAPDDPQLIWAALPSSVRATVLARRIRVTALDTAALARRHAPRPELVLRMQGVAGEVGRTAA